MTEQPTALRLADILQHQLPSVKCLEQAAAELRRLHAQRDALLDALKECLNCEFAVTDKAAISKARAAIARAEEKV